MVFSSDPGPAANPACYGSDTGMNATAGQVLVFSNIIRWIFIHTIVLIIMNATSGQLLLSYIIIRIVMV